MVQHRKKSEVWTKICRFCSAKPADDFEVNLLNSKEIMRCCVLVGCILIGTMSAILGRHLFFARCFIQYVYNAAFTFAVGFTWSLHYRATSFRLISFKLNTNVKCNFFSPRLAFCIYESSCWFAKQNTDTCVFFYCWSAQGGAHYEF